MRTLSGAASLTAVAALLALLVPGADSMAQTTSPPPSLTTLVAQAKQLEFQINALSEQYDGLRIQFGRAQADAQIAEQAAARDATALASGQQAVARLAAANYMSAGLDPTMQALTIGNPEQFLAQWYGPSRRRASRFRITPETCGTPACISRGPIWSPATSSSSSPTSRTWESTWVTA